jgi:integrase-like protein
MTALRKRMIECLQLRGSSERTQEAYVRAVRQLAQHYKKTPEPPPRRFCYCKHHRNHDLFRPGSFLTGKRTNCQHNVAKRRSRALRVTGIRRRTTSASAGASQRNREG